MNQQNLKINQQKALQRFDLVERTVEVFRLFFQLEKRTNAEVYLTLCIHFPEYHTPEAKTKFNWLWNCMKYDRNMIGDLERVIDKINEQ